MYQELHEKLKAFIKDDVCIKSYIEKWNPYTWRKMNKV